MERPVRSINGTVMIHCIPLFIVSDQVYCSIESAHLNLATFSGDIVSDKLEWMLYRATIHKQITL